MPAMNAPADPRTRYRAARDHCRRTAPTLLLACGFLPKPRRHDVFTVWAVLHQLLDIMHCEGGGESIEQRRDVCMSVLDYLFAGEVTGKGELDGFADCAARHQLPRRTFDDYVQGVAAQLAVKRYPTWKRLREHLDATAGGAAQLAVAALSGGALDETARSQAIAWGTALQLVQMLHEVASVWAQGRLVVPLDDLVACGLSEASIKQWCQAGRADDDGWRRLVDRVDQRAHNLYQGGVRCFKGLDAPAARACAVMGESVMARLDALKRATANPFGGQTKYGSLHRLRQLPRAMALVRSIHRRD